MGSTAGFGSVAKVLGLVGVLLTPGLAAADPATAEALFHDGRRLMDEGRYEEACSKLAESQAQDPASGTLINLALCYEKQGRLATAWAHYRSAISLARQDGRLDRAATAEQKTSELEPRVPHIVLTSASPPQGLLVTWTGVKVGAAALGSPIPIDPGSYEITATAPGYQAATTSVSLSEGESRTVVIPELVKVVVEPPAAAAPPAAPVRNPATVLPAPIARDPAPRSDDARIWGFAVGGAGVVGLAVGTFFGLSSLSAYNEAERECPSRRDCSDNAISARERAETRAWLSNLTLGAGLLATAAGAWLVFRPQPGNATAFVLSPRTAPGGAVMLLGATH